MKLEWSRDKSKNEWIQRIRDDTDKVTIPSKSGLQYPRHIDGDMPIVRISIITPWAHIGEVCC